jgi:hypothetical protein
MKCAQAEKNRVVQPDVGLHKGGLTSSSTMRIIFERVFGRKPTLDDMKEYLHCKDDIWDTVRAEKASEFFFLKTLWLDYNN